MGEKMQIDQDALEKAYKVIEEFRKIDETMPIQQVAVFLTIAMNEDISQKEIAEKTGMGQGSTSRNVAAFLKMNRFKRPGFDLIDNEPDPMELRVKRHRLNNKGKRIAASICDIVNKPVAYSTHMARLNRDDLTGSNDPRSKKTA